MAKQKKQDKAYKLNGLKIKDDEYVISDLIEVRGSGIQGIGVYAVKPIKKDERIIEYVGERIHPDEADERYDDDAMDRHHTFLFEVDETACIDACRVGNDARFINHSCMPNCEAVNEEGRIFVEAIRDIEPGEELTYDYGYEHIGEVSDELRKQYVCYCGSPDCRGTILKVDQSESENPEAKKKSSAA